MGDLARNLLDCKELRVGLDEIALSPFWFEAKTLDECASIRGLKIAFAIALVVGVHVIAEIVGIAEG